MTAFLGIGLVVLSIVTGTLFTEVKDNAQEIKAQKKIIAKQKSDIVFNKAALNYHNEIFEGQEQVNERNGQNIEFNYSRANRTKDEIENTVFVPYDRRTGKPLGGGR